MSLANDVLVEFEKSRWVTCDGDCMALAIISQLLDGKAHTVVVAGKPEVTYRNRVIVVSKPTALHHQLEACELCSG